MLRSFQESLVLLIRSLYLSLYALVVPRPALSPRHFPLPLVISLCLRCTPPHRSACQRWHFSELCVRRSLVTDQQHVRRRSSLVVLTSFCWTSFCWTQVQRYHRTNFQWRLAMRLMMRIVNEVHDDLHDETLSDSRRRWGVRLGDLGITVRWLPLEL